MLRRRSGDLLSGDLAAFVLATTQRAGNYSQQAVLQIPYLVILRLYMVGNNPPVVFYSYQDTGSVATKLEIGSFVIFQGL